jgi:hypothetical protein
MSGMMANRGYLAEARFGTNVIPLRVSRQALWEGHLRLLRELYTADALYRRLMRFITDPELRRDYRRHVWKAFLRRPNPRVLRDYCFFAVMHFHHRSLVQQMIADTTALGAEGEAQKLRAPLTQVAAAK